MPVPNQSGLSLQLEALRYFHVTAKCGSIRKASKQLHVAPSAISRQIANLEHDFGLELFERTSQGVTLTAAGEILARHSHSFFRDIGRVRSAINELRGLRVGEVTIYAMEGMVSHFLPRLLAHFHLSYPGISFNIFLAATDRIIEAILNDEADIGITFNAKASPNLSIEARYAEPIVCLVAPGHPLARQHSVTLKDLSHYPLALPDPAFGLRQLVDSAAKKGRFNLNTVLTTNSLELTKTLAATGTAVAFMPAFTVRSETESGLLICIPVKEEIFQKAYSHVCVHRNRVISAAAREFLNALVVEVESLGAQPVC